MTEKQLVNKIKRIPAHEVNKLDTFELLWTAAEYEKYQIAKLVEQASNLGTLTDEEKQKLMDRFYSFEPDKGLYEKTSWHKAGRTWK